MFNVKNLVYKISDVPSTWIFETFCNLKEKLNGQDIKIKSLFNPDERTPSMCIYMDVKTGDYRFKDFSTGKYGNGIQLVKELYKTSDYSAFSQLIIDKYNEFVLLNDGNIENKSFTKQSKFKVTNYHIRDWSKEDELFWTKFNIGSKLLNYYNVKPLSSYTISKQTEFGDINLDIAGSNLYGYFKNDQSLYKIYQPKNLDKKFLKVSDYIQGSEQLEKHKYLVITSSLKDIMSIKSLNLKIDIIAPDSENSLIDSKLMKQYIKSYKKVIIIFDNDDAGIESMRKYKEKYKEVEISLLPMSKDISDSIKNYGVREVKLRLIPIINSKIQNV
jgi:hypothetical protein